MRHPADTNRGEASWQCPNKFGCPPSCGRVEHFVGRKMMNIDGIGEETAQQLFDNGLVKNIADLYDLRPAQLLNLEGFGPRSAERVMEGLEASKSVPYDRVIYALSIPFVGDTVAKKLHGHSPISTGSWRHRAKSLQPPRI